MTNSKQSVPGLYAISVQGLAVIFWERLMRYIMSRHDGKKGIISFCLLISEFNPGISMPGFFISRKKTSTNRFFTSIGRFSLVKK